MTRPDDERRGAAGDPWWAGESPVSDVPEAGPGRPAGDPPAWGHPGGLPGRAAQPDYLSWRPAPEPGPPGRGRPGGRRPGRWVAVGVVAVLLAGAGLAAWHPWARGSATGTATRSATGPTGAARRRGTGPTSGPDASAGPSGRTVDPATWLRQANAYCRSTTDPELKKLLPDGNASPEATLHGIARVNRQLDAVLRRSVPSALSRDVGLIAADWDRMATLDDAAADSVHGGDVQRANAQASQAEVANQSGNTLALRVGLPDCANAGALGSTPSPTGQVI